MLVINANVTPIQMEVKSFMSGNVFLLTQFLNTLYMSYSDIISPVKMEAVSKITIFGQKMMVKSDCDRNNMKNLRKNRDKVWYINAFLVKGFAYIGICSKTNLKSIIFKANL